MKKNCKKQIRVEVEKVEKVIKRKDDAHKSSSLPDKFYDIPLGELEGLLPQPPLTKFFSKSALCYDDFLTLNAEIFQPLE